MRRTRTTSTTSHAPRVLVIAVAVGLVFGLGVPAVAHGGGQRTDVAGQGGDGVYARNGARLHRSHAAITVQWRVPTPKPGSYRYPTADQIPPGAPPHPPVEPGHPEVFSLWAFVFNHPEQCTDPCDFDDIGDTAAQGGIYQLDAVVAYGRRIRMNGKVRLGQASETGAVLSRPKDAEVHVAMTSHGRAMSGDDLARQLNGAVGGPEQWWPAIFIVH